MAAADSEEIRFLLDRAAELRLRAQGAAVVGDFHTPAEQRILTDRAGCFFWGGYRGAERRAAVFLPDWMADLAESAPAEATPVETGSSKAGSAETGSSEAGLTEAGLAEDEAPGGANDAGEKDALPEITPASPFGKAEDRRERMIEYLIASGADGGVLRENIVPVELRCSEFAQLTHRDWMGSVLALGIERRCIGDICVTSAHSALLFAARNMGKYIASDLKRAGRDGVKARIVQWEDVDVPARKFESISVTVASPRLDGVIKALCSLSRDDAAALIRDGMAEVNYFSETRCDRNVFPGDVICVRGKGKFIVDSDGGVSRKGRLRLEIRKYV